MNNKEKCFEIAKKMLNFTENDNLDDILKCMLTDACEMTEKCGGLFLSRQAIAVIVVCWSYSNKS